MAAGGHLVSGAVAGTGTLVMVAVVALVGLVASWRSPPTTPRTGVRRSARSPPPPSRVAGPAVSGKSQIDPS